MKTSSKLCTVEQAADIAKSAHAAKQTVVTINGAFDLLSLAHVRFLESAKEQGDILMVGVNSDASIRLLKGKDRPIVSEGERSLLVAALACTDHVFLFDDEDPRRWLATIKPDVHVNSDEYGEDCIEASTLREIGTKLVLLPRATDILSTTQRIESIIRRGGESRFSS